MANVENNNSSNNISNDIGQLYNTFISLVISFIPIILVIVLYALDTISAMSAMMIIIIVILALYIFNLSFNLKFSAGTAGTASSTTDDCSICGTPKCLKHAELHRLHTQLHSGNGYGSGYRQGLGNTSICPNKLPVWENYLRKYGILYDDLGNEQSVPDDGIKYIAIEYNTPTDNNGISLSEIQVWESTGTTTTAPDSGNENIVSGLTNIAAQGSIDVTTGFITSSDPNTDLSGNNSNNCADLDGYLSNGVPSEVYYHSHGTNGRHSHVIPSGPQTDHNPEHNHYGSRGHSRAPIDRNHYNDSHDPSTHSHNSSNARPIHEYHNDDHGCRNSVTHSRNHGSIYDKHIKDHYLEGMVSGDLRTKLTNNNFSDQYLNITTDTSSNTIVQQETLKMGLHTSKNHDELYVVRLITPTTLMNATVSLLNGSQQVLYSKKVKENANVYTFKLGAVGNETNINTAIDNYDSSYTQKTYDVCPIPKNRRQFAINHLEKNPKNNMNCSRETFVSTINLKPLSIKATPITNDLI